MREILFRGKRIDNGKFTDGYLVEQNNPEYHAYIIKEFKAEMDNLHMDILACDMEDVDPSTVGQFTGLTDKNGKKIFEGDIVRVVSTDYVGFDEIGKVELQGGCFGVSYFPTWERKYSFGKWHFHRFGHITKWQDMSASGEMKYTYEVVGNIHDNPELLEVQYVV